MLNLLQRGRLEVETDLLLGAEQVLLRPIAAADLDASLAGGGADVAEEVAPRSARPVEQPHAESSSRGAPARGFDAALFATGAGGAPVARTDKPPVQHVADGHRARPSALPAVSPATTSSADQRRDRAQFGVSFAAEATPTSVPIAPLVDRVRPPEGAGNAARLYGLAQLHARSCPHCTTSTSHSQLVFGEGNPDAELVFVGEAPGETEDRLGRPFVGRAGEKLDEMISAMGLRREEVYIANVLKSRPPDNRTPLAHEIDACGPYLLAQLAIIRPKAIVTLGGPASKLLLASELGITRLRGIPATVRLGVADGQPFDVPVMPTFHPAYLLRNYTVETRQQVWEDLKKVLGLLGRAVPVRASAHNGATQHER